MIETLSHRILNILINNNAVTDNNKAVVLFGIEQGLRSLFEIAIMLLTGLLMNLFWESAIILISFIPVRIYAGGYHAKTPMQCAIKSWMLLTAVLLWMKYTPNNAILQIFVLMITGIWMFCLCPVQDEHKPLSEKEKRKYKVKAFRNFFLDFCVFGIGYFSNIPVLSRCIALGTLMLLVMLVAGTIKNNKKMNDTN